MIALFRKLKLFIHGNSALTPKILMLWFIAGLNFVSYAKVEDNVRLKASALYVNQTPTGAIMNLSGPVEINYGDHNLKATGAKVTLRSGSKTLSDAIVQIILSGNVEYSGLDGAKAVAASATLLGDERLLILDGGSSFRKGDIFARANQTRYAIDAKTIELLGKVELQNSSTTSTGKKAKYDFNTGKGMIAGDVSVTYRTNELVFDEKPVREVILEADSLEISSQENEIRTPRNIHGTRIKANDYTFYAEQVVFYGSGDNGIERVTGNGNAYLNGPQGIIKADEVMLSVNDRVFYGSGNVVFSVMGQEGDAEKIEVNFRSGWLVKLTGGRIKGSPEELKRIVFE